MPCNCCRFVSARKFSAVWTSSSNCGFFCSSSRKTFCNINQNDVDIITRLITPAIRYTVTNAKPWFSPHATVTQRIAYNRCDVQTVANCNLMTRSRTAWHTRDTFFVRKFNVSTESTYKLLKHIECLCAFRLNFVPTVNRLNFLLHDPLIADMKFNQFIVCYLCYICTSIRNAIFK